MVYMFHTNYFLTILVCVACLVCALRVYFIKILSSISDKIGPCVLLPSNTVEKKSSRGLISCEQPKSHQRSIKSLSFFAYNWIPIGDGEATIDRLYTH
jgi:hypothetical protein